MKRSKKMAALLLTLVMLINGMCVTAFAASESPVLLSASEAASGAVVQVNVLANKTGIADGKLVITYDAAKLSLVELTSADAWNAPDAVAYSVNHSAGQITVTFASPSYAVRGEAIFAITFLVLNESDTEVAIVGEQSYITGFASVADVTTTVKAQIHYGDLNGDGKLTTRDAIILLDKIASREISNMSDAQFAVADANADGKINSRDAIVILRAVVSRTPISHNGDKTR